MEVRSIVKFVRISPKKAIYMARELRDKKALDVVNMLRVTSGKAAYLIRKAIFSAIANAENNFNLDKNMLSVKSVTIGCAPTMKRHITKARGMSGRIRKRMSHLNVILSN
jgi:large subunit ribosomal protein L22